MMQRRTPLPRRTGLTSRSVLPRTGRLPYRSPRRAVEMAEYRPLAAEFLAEHPRCQFPLGCNRRATAVHHRRGRAGKRLLDQRWWKASCDLHNDMAETDTGAALACGWLVRIEGVGPG